MLQLGRLTQFWQRGKILRSSHYIGHPMYMENKLGYLFADQLLKLYDRHVGQKPPTKETLLAELDVLVTHPELA